MQVSSIVTKLLRLHHAHLDFDCTVMHFVAKNSNTVRQAYGSTESCSNVIFFGFRINRTGLAWKHRLVPFSRTLIKPHRHRATVLIPPAGACQLKEYWFSGFCGSACPLRASGHSVNARWNITDQVCKTFSAGPCCDWQRLPLLGLFSWGQHAKSVSKN